ncbi:hypothetical protein [Salipaludibacillus sp. CF4.18]|uniref:hypothetical protein n=1 Tax=Salipaludibacillus sp. CF4.18 TaxID=3373081 RepID=UPI003EE56986
MMAFLSALLMILFVSFDGLIWGVLIGYKRHYFPFFHFILLTAGTALILWAFYHMGIIIEDFIPFELFNKISGAILLILSIYHLIDGEGVFKRALLLKVFIIVNIDNIGFGLSAGYSNLNEYVPIFAGVLFGVLFLVGLYVSYRLPVYKLQQLGELLPFLVLFSMGLFKLLI